MKPLHSLLSGDLQKPRRGLRKGHRDERSRISEGGAGGIAPSWGKISAPGNDVQAAPDQECALGWRNRQESSAGSRAKGREGIFGGWEGFTVPGAEQRPPPSSLAGDIWGSLLSFCGLSPGVTHNTSNLRPCSF